MLKKHLAPALLLCAGLLLSACGAAEAPGSAQSLSADLDGDGTNEVLINATHYKQGLMSRGSFNDYSFVLLRKVVNGKVQEQVLAGDFGSAAAGMNTPAQYKLSAIADLNGDGKMEVVIFAEYYEGSWIEVYEMNGNEAKLVEPLKIACGV